MRNITLTVLAGISAVALLPHPAVAGTSKTSYDTGGDETPLGKTGTCSDDQSRVGWFMTYADETHPKIVLVVLLRGNTRRVKGPTAATIAGRIYRRLREQNYFATAQLRRSGVSASSVPN